MNEANNVTSKNTIPVHTAGEKDGDVAMNTKNSEKFGPWMIVARKGKPKFVVEKENITAAERNQRNNILVTSRFDALSEDSDINTTVELAFGNKEDDIMSDDENFFVNETLEMHGEADLELRAVQNGIQSWVTVVYASPNSVGRRALWYHLNSIVESMHDPWIVGGNFNSILYAEEKRGGSSLSTGICPNFNSWFHANHIVDLQFSGPRYTWTRENLSKRLDRAMSNQEWLLKFDNYSVTHLPRVEYDHSLIDNEEIRRAIFQMSPFKALGIDGFPTGFYQTQWHIVGDSFCSGIKDIFNSHGIPNEVNKTLLVLIPKTEHPTSFKMYCPISFCTTSFDPGRHITENIIIAQEVVHSMRRKMGKKDDLLLFAEATSGQAHFINSVLEDFCLSSGAKVEDSVELASGHLNIDPSCERCGAGLENTIHVLRDCPYSRAVWLRLIRGNNQHHFFESSLTDWMSENLQSHNTSLAGRNRIEKWIRWIAPTWPWVKLNTDGAMKPSGHVGAGGLIRDYRGV
ncbi:hypothetical protein KPL70_008335 [Citrus sinensis]|nr:hypothetical protein KPL70_008335 [Citrus sinensis]